MFLKIFKSLFYLCVGVLLVYILKDLVKALLIGLVIIVLVEVVEQKVIGK